MLRLSEEERFNLRVLQRSHRGHKLYIRITVLLMLDMGFDIASICLSLGIDDLTIRNYVKLYESTDLETYLTLNYVGYLGKLTAEEQEILVEEIDQNLYLTAKEVCDFVKRKFNKTYSLSAMTRVLGRLNFVYKKTSIEPANFCPPPVQTAFLEEMTTILTKIEQDSASVGYFLDAVHPQHNTKSDYGWIKKGSTFPIFSNSGRQRLNINGALNAHEVTDVVIDEAATIDQNSVKRLIEKIAKKHPKKTIYLFHDNARYYYAKDLKLWLKKEYPNIKQVFLPPYSPNFNLIERLWKFMKKEVIHYDFYPTFKDFKQAVLNFFQNINGYKDKLMSLLTLNFHVQKT